jgi:hypothetical protein
MEVNRKTEHKVLRPAHTLMTARVRLTAVGMTREKAMEETINPGN